MCGIVGVISKSTNGLFYTDMDLFQNMLVCDSLRGEDSTGVFGVYKNRQARTIKVAAEPHMLFRCPEWDDFRTKAISSMQIVVGHNRSATRGAVTTNNAHPFSEGKIVLVHNGTLHNQKDFNKEVEVDSHAITHALNERPAKEVLKEIDGAFAFVWYNRDDQKLYIARNSERPLSFVETSTNIYFASEAGMLDFVLSRKPGAHDKAQPFPVGKLISFDARGNKEEEDFELFTRPKPMGVVTYHRKPTIITPTTTTGTTGSSTVIKGDIVLIKVTEIEPIPTNNGLIKIKGKLVTHDYGTDCTGLCAKGLTTDEAKHMLTLDYVQAEVSGTWNTTCGKSYFVHNVSLAEHVQVYNNNIPKAEWDYICDNVECDKCMAPILPHETTLTSVKRRKNGIYRVVCSDCVTEAIDAKTAPNIEDSTTKIQPGEPISQGPSNWPFPKAQQNSLIH